MKDYDACIIGSGAGAGPVALCLAQAGLDVVVLEKGPWFSEQDFYKDEMACCRSSTYTPDLDDEQHVIEDYAGRNEDGSYRWAGTPTSESGWDFWNGNCVGGSSNFMSGFFYRLKPFDFRLLSEFGAIEGANVVDWPISYSDLEPYYTMVEHEVGVSGRVVEHPFQEPRSSKDFPYPPTLEHPISSRIDAACQKLGFHSIPTPRAILPYAVDKRRGCEYSGFCGSYGCATGAKGSARAALLDRAILTGHCEMRDHAKVNRIVSDKQGRITHVEYADQNDQTQRVNARIYVVACQAIETARLLLLSSGPAFPAGLANRSGQVGRNLLFSAGGSGQGELIYANESAREAARLKARGPFVNRGIQDWYVIKDKKGRRLKGGTVDLLLRHPNAISRANAVKWDDNNELLWGSAFKQALKQEFTTAQILRYEVFCDWLPTDDCFVSLDMDVRDKWQQPVARVRIGYHDHDLRVGEVLSDQAQRVLHQMGAANVSGGVSGTPPQNLVAGGCRFGDTADESVLDADCRSHDIDNLFVTDGSFMPTGGSVPFTWTIYANAFRVADKIIDQLGKKTG